MFLYRQALRRTWKIIAVSEFTKHYLLNQEADLADKIEVITNGIDLEYFKSTDSDNRKINSKRHILFVGGVKNRKGVIEAIEAVAVYRDRYERDFIFDIVGSFDARDAYCAAVQARAKELSLEGQVFFHGRVDEDKLREFYQKADLFILLAKNDGVSFEGFGLVYLEANAYGVPVIGSRDSGASEAIRDGQTGFVVDPENAISTAGRIHAVLDENLIFPENCRDWASKNSIAPKAQKIIEIYGE